MQTQAAGCEVLDRMWANHRDSVWRALLSLTRDIDLADDLLQDTYLRARQGIGTYRGGDLRPWLLAIARNVYYSHGRLRRIRAEVPCDLAEVHEERPSVDLLCLLAIRQALADLPAAFRTALVMKHYAGYTYQEIARHQRCPIGTAKWRVSEALGRLRLVLLERRPRMASAEAHGIAMVDYVYGVLPEAEAAKVRTHLAECAACRKEAEELKQVVTMLDVLAGDTKQMHFIELDRRGGHTLYVSGSHANMTGETLTRWQFHSGRGGKVEHFYQDGEEAPFTIEPSGPLPPPVQWENLDLYTVTLPHPVPPGGRVNDLSVFPNARRFGMEKPEDGRFRFHWEQSPGEPDTAYVQVVRLPVGAHLLTADPQPAEVRTNNATTVVWRAVLGKNEAFECTVEYRLT